jgi:Spy/CpxP family protein refolding chaperone
MEIIMKRLYVVVLALLLSVSSLFAQKSADSGKEKPPLEKSDKQKNTKEAPRHNQHRRDLGEGDLARGLGFSKIFEQLNLTEAQQQSIDALLEKFTNDIDPLQSQLLRFRNQQKDALEQDKYDLAKTLTDEIKNTEAEIAKKRIDFLESVNKLLTPEQKEQLKNMQPKERKRGVKE